MGLKMKPNKKGDKLKVTCSMSGHKYFDGKLATFEQVKALLIERALSKFIDNVIQIDMDFPNGYSFDFKHQHDVGEGFQFNDWRLKQYTDTGWDNVVDKFEETMKKHDIDLTKLKE